MGIQHLGSCLPPDTKQLQVWRTQVSASLHFPVQRPRCVNSKSTCAHLCIHVHVLKRRVVRCIVSALTSWGSWKWLTIKKQVWSQCCSFHFYFFRAHYQDSNAADANTSIQEALVGSCCCCRWSAGALSLCARANLLPLQRSVPSYLANVLLW